MFIQSKCELGIPVLWELQDIVLKLPSSPCGFWEFVGAYMFAVTSGFSIITWVLYILFVLHLLALAVKFVSLISL
jgi:hypothetical protein